MSEKEKKSPTLLQKLLKAFVDHRLKKFGPCSYEMQDRLLDEAKKRK